MMEEVIFLLHKSSGIKVAPHAYWRGGGQSKPCVLLAGTHHLPNEVSFGDRNTISIHLLPSIGILSRGASSLECPAGDWDYSSLKYTCII